MSDLQLPALGLAEDILSRYKDKPGELQLVTFNLGEEYGVRIRQVQEIVRVEGITRVPNAPPYMEGVINLRGRVLPVLSLRKRLKLPDAATGRDARIVVTEIGSKVVGLLVDAVSQVIKVSSEAVEAAPEEVLEVETDYITGVATLNERLIILLDLERLLKRENISVQEEADLVAED